MLLDGPVLQSSGGCESWSFQPRAHSAFAWLVVRGNRPHLIGECIPFFLFFKTSKSSPNGSSPHQSPVVPEGTGTCFLNAQAAGRAGPLSGRTAGLGGGERADPGGLNSEAQTRGAGACGGKRNRDPGKARTPGTSAVSCFRAEPRPPPPRAAPKRRNVSRAGHPARA